MAELRTEFEKALENFVRDSMKDAPALYAKYFSAQELRDIAGLLQDALGCEIAGTDADRDRRIFRHDDAADARLLPTMIEATIDRVLQKHGFKR